MLVKNKISGVKCVTEIAIVGIVLLEVYDKNDNDIYHKFWIVFSVSGNRKLLQFDKMWKELFKHYDVNEKYVEAKSFMPVK